MMTKEEKENDESIKEWAQKLIEFYTATLGVLLGLTPIIVFEVNFPLQISILLTFTTHFMLIDDWWMSYSLFQKYPPRAFSSLFYDLIWIQLFLGLYIILIAAGRGFIPLTVYLILLSIMSVIDAIGDYMIIRQYPNMKMANKEDYVKIVTWTIMGPVAAVFFFLGYVFLEMGASLELTAILILVMYLIRRVIDLLAPRLYLAIIE